MRSLSARESRLLAVLALIAAIAAVDLAVVDPLVSGFAQRRTERQALQARLDANNRMIAAIPRLRRQAEAGQRAMARYVLTAPDPESAGQMLRDHLQNAVHAVGGEFRGSEDFPPVRDRVTVRIDAAVTAGQLAALLAGIQNSPPFLTIGSLVVNADDAAIVGQASQLEIQLEASVPLRLSRAR